jgi:hypothetical protein
VSKFDFLTAYIERLPDSNAFELLKTCTSAGDREHYKWKNGYKYALRPGMGETELRLLEAEAGVVVPEELREFYMFSYGADLGDHRILTIPEITTLISELQGVYKDLWRDSILPFAYVMDLGNFIAFDLGQASSTQGLPILDCFHELSPEEWKVICFGLKNWLVQMVENDFQPFWL